MATLTIASPALVRAKAIAYGKIPVAPAERAHALAMLIDNDGWTIAEYIAWINRDSECFALMGPECWAERGITTASALGQYLDAEHERNMEKERRYG